MFDLSGKRALITGASGGRERSQEKWIPVFWFGNATIKRANSAFYGSSV